MLGIPLVAPDGKRAFGGHTFRVSGARHLSYRGLETRIIMLLARWESEIILRYVKDAPLARLADLYCANGAASSANIDSHKAGVLPFSSVQLDMAEEHAREAKLAVDKLAARVEELEAREVRCARDDLPTFIVSDYGRGCIHKVITDYLVVPHAHWRTYCGWAYGDSHFKREKSVNHLPAERRCKVCISKLGYETT